MSCNGQSLLEKYAVLVHLTLLTSLLSPHASTTLFLTHLMCHMLSWRMSLMKLSPTHPHILHSSHVTQHTIPLTYHSLHLSHSLAAIATITANGKLLGPLPYSKNFCFSSNLPPKMDIIGHTIRAVMLTGYVALCSKIG